MTAGREQSGYALLMMLTMLLGGSAAALLRLADAQSLSPVPRFSESHHVLMVARQALISYSTLYPYLYGPRGAGPGHLPCPDTDWPPGAATAPSVSRDGPNPPCGSADVAAGRLPRHINFSRQRYAFHTQPGQHISYRVSSDVINNPLNRAVNDQRLQSMTREQPLPAWIEYAEDRSRNRSTLFMRVPVTRQSLMSGARVAVAAWVTERVMRPVVRDCLGETLTFASCMVADQSASTDDRLLVEGVPWKLHWYVRNHWHERISVAAATGCIAPDFVTCRLIHEPYRHGAAQATGSGNDDTRLSFIWQSLSR